MRRYKDLICKLEENCLGNIPFHESVPFIKRVCSKNFPLHLAIHEISTATKKNVREYAKLHIHNAPEINILIDSKGNLKYNILLGPERYIVEAPAAIWIPKGLEHSANFISGEGYYICLKFSDKYFAYKNESG